jgi:hypothetical protein
MEDTEIDVDVIHAAWDRLMEMSQEYCESVNSMLKTYPELRGLVGINLAISTAILKDSKHHMAMQLTMGRSDLVQESLNALQEAINNDKCN